MSNTLETNRGLKTAVKAAVAAAQEVGGLLRKNLHAAKRANEVTQHDIKLELDVRSQKLIERRLHAAFPEVSLLGEEGEAGESTSQYRWVVDPIDGTVNFSYGIPHACVSIALQGKSTRPGRSTYADGYDTLAGVVYDPFCDEMWTAVRGGPAKLNGRITRVSSRANVKEAVISIGFAKSRENLQATLPYFVELVHRVRKIRIMGAAALALTYVASGRFDAYIERGIRLWDIAAGGLILECAGGVFRREAVDRHHTYRMAATNQAMSRKFKLPKY